MVNVSVPVDPEAERLLLAAAALNRQAWEVLAEVDGADFYHQAHRRIADALLPLGPQVPLVFVLADHRARWLPPVDGYDGHVLAAAIDECWTPLLAPRWAGRVQDTARRRRLMQAAADVYNSEAADPDVLAELHRLMVAA